MLNPSFEGTGERLIYAQYSEEYGCKCTPLSGFYKEVSFVASGPRRSYGDFILSLRNLKARLDLRRAPLGVLREQQELWTC